MDDSSQCLFKGNTSKMSGRPFTSFEVVVDDDTLVQLSMDESRISSCCDKDLLLRLQKYLFTVCPNLPTTTDNQAGAIPWEHCTLSGAH